MEETVTQRSDERVTLSGQEKNSKCDIFVERHSLPAPVHAPYGSAEVSELW